MNIIILGDKYQKRMKCQGCSGLLKYKEHNIIYNQYVTLLDSFIEANIIYVYGFDAKRLVAYIDNNNLFYNRIKLVYNPDYEKYNNCYNLNLVKEYLNDDTLITFGNQPLSKSTFNNFNKNHDDVKVFINNKTKNKLGCIITSESLVTNISYDLENYLSEIYFIPKSRIEIFKSFVNNPMYYNCFIFEIINKMIDQNIRVSPNYIK